MPWQTLVWRVGVPGCPQLDYEEGWPAYGVDQHYDQSHPHCLGHGFSDAGRRGRRRVGGSVVNGAAGWLWGHLVRRERLLAIGAGQWLLLWRCWRCCCCYTLTTATVVLNSGRCVIVALTHLAVVHVIVRNVIRTLQQLSSSPLPPPISRGLSSSLLAPVVLLL